MGLEYLEYLFGGLLYLFSATFREKKAAQWEKSGSGQKIADVGMWLTIPAISLLTLYIVLLKAVTT